jgi:predicted RND superfamily exporter protein
MGTYFKAIDRFAAALTRTVIARRWWVITGAVVLAAIVGTGAGRLEFSTNYRVFFSEANPELQAFENLQDTYTKNDNFFFVIEPRSGEAFDAETLAAVEELTEAAWQIPYAIRVDSVSNFQHTYATEDDLIVEDLVSGATGRGIDYLAERRGVALAEPLLRDQIVTADAGVTAVNVVLQYPEKGLMEVPEAVGFARDVKAQIEADFPDVQIHLTGVSMLNNAFAETGMTDAGTLMPLMFVVIFALTWLIIRSFTATISTLVVIMLSTIVGMGAAGFAGVKLTPIAMSAPVVILTLAVADSIHILLSLRGLMREGLGKTEALVEAVRINFLPVSITSLTTIVGFLSLNFSDSPPYWHLGNITAVGIAAAWLYSITLLPALISVLPYRTKQAAGGDWSQRVMDRLADAVIGNYRKLFVGVGLASFALIAFIPTIDFNDQWVEYFDERIEFRNDSDEAQEFFGLYPIEYSVPAAGPGGVSEPEFLTNLESFADFLRAHPSVTHVYSLSDIMKRLNRNMHGDDEAYYRIPGDRELSAQYLLLYELSLPYGLDLNDRINVDKSATRVTSSSSPTSSSG